MNTVQIILIVLNILLFLNIMKWFYKLYYAKRYIKKWNEFKSARKHGEQVHIIIPVLDEVKRLRTTITKLQKKLTNIKIIIVTTEKEYEIMNLKQIRLDLLSCKKRLQVVSILKHVNSHFDCDESEIAHIDDFDLYRQAAVGLIDKCINTIDLANELKKEYDNIYVYHYQGAGNMSAQVNYAVQCYVKESENQNPLFALYNADSIIDQRTIDWVLTIIESNPNKSMIFQQYGHYTPISKRLSGKSRFVVRILNAVGMWQTRWSLGYEMANAVEQFKNGCPVSNDYLVQKRKAVKFSYCIGHGLFFRYSVIKQVNWFSEKTHNEDMMMGLQVCSHNIPIIPIPFLEESESPGSVKAAYIQKSTWFFGPFEAFKYYKLISRDESYGCYDRRKLFLYTILLFEDSIRWIGVPIQVACILLLSIFYLPFLLPLSITLVFLYLPFLNYFANQQYKEKRLTLMLLPSLVFFMLHFLSAIRSMKNMLKLAILKVDYCKEKTPLD